MRYPLLWFLLSDDPAGIVAELQEVAVFIGHLTRDAHLVAVEVVSLLVAFTFFVGPVVYLYQGFVAVESGVDIRISTVRLDFLQEVAAVPNESGFLFDAV